MFNVDYETGEITMHRGDTGSYVLHAARSDGSSWTEDDRLLYTVKNSKGEIVLQRLYRLDDQWNLGDGVVLVEFHNSDTDTWENDTYAVERRYVIDPIWEGTPPTTRCANALTADARMVEGAIVRVPATGQTSMKLDDIYGEV